MSSMTTDIATGLCAPRYNAIGSPRTKDVHARRTATVTCCGLGPESMNASATAAAGGAYLMSVIAAILERPGGALSP
jgi:hypothetical protein